MKIKDMIVTPIAFTDPPLLNAAGLHAPYALRIILEVVADDGVYGLGEIAGGSAVLEALEEAREAIIGMNPFDRNAIRLRMEERFAGRARGSDNGYASAAQTVARRMFSAIDVALFDLLGKELGVPVYDLLGGKVRPRAEFSAYLFYKYEGAGGTWGMGHNPEATGWHKAKEDAALDPQGVVRQCQAMVDAYGFRAIKLKGGVFPPAEEIAAMYALKEAFPEAPLRIDPNACWSLETSIDAAKKLEGALQYLEDPCKGQLDMAKLRNYTNLPLATNMCTTSFEDLPTSVALHSEDIILSDHHFWGGLDATMKLGQICRTFGRKLSMHSNSHMGISMMAMAHLGVALPEIDYEIDTHYPWQSEEVIAGGRVVIEDGCIDVPAKPGLGVELDRKALAALHQNFLDCGIRDRNDEVQMQKVNPGWTFANHHF